MTLFPAICTKLTVFGFARFEANGGAGGNIETAAISSGAVELEGGICFDEMVVTADLDGAVAKICDRKGNRGAAGVQFDLTFVN